MSGHDMLRTLLIGFGRAGAGLHWSTLRRLRAEGEHTQLFAAEPPVVWDPGPARDSAAQEGLLVASSLAQAARELDPTSTVVHLCSPPDARLETLREVAALGFRRILVEKPLAVDAASAHRIAELRESYGLSLVSVTQWLRSALTLRLAELVAGGELGRLRGVAVVQRKPRMMRTLRDQGHPTAFDVELPHSVGVVLRLAGNAEVTDAAGSDMRVGDVIIPRMGTAWLRLQHTGGPVSEIFTDLTSPVRERRIELTFEAGRVVGYYPASEADHFAALSVTGPTGGTDQVFYDDSLSAFFVHTYQRFASAADQAGDFALAVRVVELLDAAKERCRRMEAGSATNRLTEEESDRLLPAAVGAAPAPRAGTRPTVTIGARSTDPRGTTGEGNDDHVR